MGIFFRKNAHILSRTSFTILHIQLQEQSTETRNLPIKQNILLITIKNNLCFEWHRSLALFKNCWIRLTSAKNVSIPNQADFNSKSLLWKKCLLKKNILRSLDAVCPFVSYLIFCAIDFSLNECLSPPVWRYFRFWCYSNVTWDYWLFRKIHRIQNNFRNL